MRWLFGHPGECPGDGRSHGYFWKRFVSDASFDILNIRLKNWRGCRRKSIAEKADQVTNPGTPVCLSTWLGCGSRARQVYSCAHPMAGIGLLRGQQVLPDRLFLHYLSICSFPSHGPWWLMRSPALVRASRRSFLRCAILGPSTPSG